MGAQTQGHRFSSLTWKGMNSGRGDRCRLEGNNLGIPGALSKHTGRAGIQESGVRDWFQNVKLEFWKVGAEVWEGKSTGRMTSGYKD